MGTYLISRFGVALNHQFGKVEEESIESHCGYGPLSTRTDGRATTIATVGMVDATLSIARVRRGGFRAG